MADVKFEGLVRPFQSRDITPPKIVPFGEDPTAGPAKTVKFEWGKSASGGQAQIVSWNSSISVQLYMEKRQKEQKTGGGGNDPFAGGLAFQL